MCVCIWCQLESAVFQNTGTGWSFTSKQVHRIVKSRTELLRICTVQEDQKLCRTGAWISLGSRVSSTLYHISMDQIIQSPSHEQLINVSRMTNHIVAIHISLSCIQRIGGIFIEGEVFVITPASRVCIHKNIASRGDEATRNCLDILQSSLLDHQAIDPWCVGGGIQHYVPTYLPACRTMKEYNELGRSFWCHTRTCKRGLRLFSLSLLVHIW